MRSRFTAFAVGDVDHLLHSWHPRTRPESLDLDPSMRWYRLDVDFTHKGSVFDATGEVAFTAFYRVRGGEAGSLKEHSRFERLDGHWVYVDGVVAP